MKFETSLARLTRFELIRYTLEECGFIQLDYRRLIKLDSFFKTYVIPNHKSLSNCCKSLLYLNLLPLVGMEWLEHSTSRFGVLDKSCTCIESFTFKLLKHKSGPLTNWDTSPYKILDTLKNPKKYLFQLNIFPSIFILIAVSVYFQHYRTKPYP